MAEQPVLTPVDILTAGGILPSQAPLPEDLPTDRLSARAYTHPALPHRTVVRLEPDAIADGVDMEMSLMGFPPPVVSGDLGWQRRRAPGFPAWALVNDPARARYALEVMKEFRVEAAKAKSKPAFARDGFNAIALRLGATAPHFLPSFWEEAGRAFLEAGNASFAASSFDRARTAEREFGLRPDEDHRFQTFLEFALAGAVTVKSLSTYAKDLEKSQGVAEAYQRFSQLCVRRTLGGLPPWTDMPKELRRLAKAARLDVEAEEERFLLEVLEAPCLSRALAGFWDHYRPVLLRLAAGSPKLRGRLLNLFPSPHSAPEGFNGKWMALLEAAGCLAAVLEPDGSVPKEAEAAGGPVGWFFKLLEFLEDDSTALLVMLRRMAPRLLADGLPLRLQDPDSWYHELPVDLTDLALELGLPLQEPLKDSSLDLAEWAKAEGTPSEPRPRDPRFLAADERFAGMLRQAVSSAAGDTDFERVAVNCPSLKEYRKEWLLQVVSAVDVEGLPALSNAVSQVENRTARPIFQEFPEALEILEKVDPVRPVWRSLQAGILDELAWPLFEQTYGRLSEGGKVEVTLDQAFPSLVLRTATKAVALGAQAVLVDHDLQLPKGGRQREVWNVGEKLLVTYHDERWTLQAYWSHQPDEKFAPNGGLHHGRTGVLTEDGRLILGGGSLRPGDTAVPDCEKFFSDGKQFWKLIGDGVVIDDEDEDDERTDASRPLTWVSMDPLTGAPGAPSVPAFFASLSPKDLASHGSRLALYPLPWGLQTSRVGAAQGVYGLRVTEVAREGGEVAPRLETSSGLCFQGYLPDRQLPSMLLSFPGDDRPRPLVESSRWYAANGARLFDPTGTFESHQAVTEEEGDSTGSNLLSRLSLSFYHCFEPRDLAGSQALRGLEEETVRRLLEAALAELPDDADRGDEDEDEDEEAPARAPLPETAKRLEALVPAITDPILKQGVLYQLQQGAQLSRRLTKAIAARRGETEETLEASDEGVGERELREALGKLGGSGWGYQGTWRAIQVVSDYFRTALRPPLETEVAPKAGKKASLPEASLPWWEWPGRARALAWVAVYGDRGEEDQARLVKLLQHWRQTVFADPTLPAFGLRYVKMTFEEASHTFLEQHQEDGEPVVHDRWLSRSADGHYWYVQVSDGYSAPYHLDALELSADGTFALPSGAVLQLERVISLADEGAWLSRFLELLAARGPVPYAAEQGELLSARAGLPKASMVLLQQGLYQMQGWKADFLGKERRERLGLKLQDAKQAREALKHLEAGELAALLTAAAPDDPEAFWTPLGAGPEDDNSPLARLARAAKESLAPKESLPIELIELIEKELDVPMGERELLAALLEPEKALSFQQNADYILQQGGDLEVAKGSPSAYFGEEELKSLAQALPWLATFLPAGNPLVRGLGSLLKAARARLTHPGLLLPLSQEWEEHAEKQRPLVEGLGGEVYRPADADEDYLTGRDNGVVLGIIGDNMVSFAFRPARVRDYGQESLLERLAALDESADPPTALQAAAFISSPGAEALVGAVNDSAVPAGGYLVNPLHSVPALVAEVQQAQGLSQDAAVAWLQLLTLATPSSKNLQAWNGWKAPQLKKALAELTGKGLVEEGKRARAGREHFLPGGWYAIKKGPDLPLETWKLPLYGVKLLKDGSLHLPLGRILPMEPVASLFEKAWAQVKAGKGPSRQEVRS